MSELFGMNPAYTRAALENKEPYDMPPEPGAFGNLFGAIGGGLASIEAEVKGVAFEGMRPALEATQLFNKEWLDQKQNELRWNVKAAQPDPATTGFASNIIGSFLNIGPEALVGGIAGSALSPAGATAGAAFVPSVLQGYKEMALKSFEVDQETANMLGWAKGATTAVAVGLPVAMRGLSLFGNFGVGAIGNTVSGMADRYATHAILERDYPVMAEHYKWHDATAVATDMILGGLMGLATGKVMDMQAAREARGLPPTKAIDTATEDSARVLDGAIQREQGPGLFTAPEDAAKHAEILRSVSEQIWEGKMGDQIVIPDNAPKNIIPDPSVDVLGKMMQDTVESIAKPIKAEVEAVREATKSVQQKAPEVEVKQDAKPEAVPESLDAFLSNDAKKVADEMNPTIDVGGGPQKAQDVLKQAEAMIDEATKMGRLNKIAVACALSRGDV